MTLRACTVALILLSMTLPLVHGDDDDYSYDPIAPISCNTSDPIVLHGTLGCCSCNEGSQLLDCRGLGLSASALPTSLAKCSSLGKIILNVNQLTALPGQLLNGLNNLMALRVDLIFLSLVCWYLTK
jgi:hypothetical protein